MSSFRAKGATGWRVGQDIDPIDQQELLLTSEVFQKQIRVPPAALPSTLAHNQRVRSRPRPRRPMHRGEGTACRIQDPSPLLQTSHDETQPGSDRAGHTPTRRFPSDLKKYRGECRHLLSTNENGNRTNRPPGRHSIARFSWASPPMAPNSAGWPEPRCATGFSRQG